MFCQYLRSFSPMQVCFPWDACTQVECRKYFKLFNDKLFFLHFDTKKLPRVDFIWIMHPHMLLAYCTHIYIRWFIVSTSTSSHSIYMTHTHTDVHTQKKTNPESSWLCPSHNVPLDVYTRCIHVRIIILMIVDYSTLEQLCLSHVAFDDLMSSSTTPSTYTSIGKRKIPCLKNRPDCHVWCVSDEDLTFRNHADAWYGWQMIGCHISGVAVLKIGSHFWVAYKRGRQI